MTDDLRDTPYATELVRSCCPFPDGTEARIERLRFKQTDVGQEGYRFSWWKDGKMARRPLDGTEEQILDAFRAAILAGVFTPQFKATLREMLASDIGL